MSNEEAPKLEHEADAFDKFHEVLDPLKGGEKIRVTFKSKVGSSLINSVSGIYHYPEESEWVPDYNSMTKVVKPGFETETFTFEGFRKPTSLTFFTKEGAEISLFTVEKIELVED